jgi:hypothetical protein
MWPDESINSSLMDLVSLYRSLWQLYTYFGISEFVADVGEMRNTYKILVRKPEGKRSLGRPSCWWESNIKMGLRNVGTMMWNGFIWLRIWTSGELLWTWYKIGNFLTSSVTVSYAAPWSWLLNYNFFCVGILRIQNQIICQLIKVISQCCIPDTALEFKTASS